MSYAEDELRELVKSLRDRIKQLEHDLAMKQRVNEALSDQLCRLQKQLKESKEKASKRLLAD